MILARTEKQEERRDVSEGRGGVVMDLGFGYVDVFIDDDRKNDVRQRSCRTTTMLYQQFQTCGHILPKLRTSSEGNLEFGIFQDRFSKRPFRLSGLFVGGILSLVFLHAEFT